MTLSEWYLSVFHYGRQDEMFDSSISQLERESTEEAKTSIIERTEKIGNFRLNHLNTHNLGFDMT